MIHVCSLARLHATVAGTGSRHIVTLMKDIALVERPHTVDAQNHLHIKVDDITCPIDGYTHPCEQHVEALMSFAKRWDRTAPLVVHCYAGISRSTAGAYAVACALSTRDEMQIARDIRRASPTAMPNPLIVSLADRLLGRQGRMVAAIEAIGPGDLSSEADPFSIELK